jgi:hypothetical protein
MYFLGPVAQSVEQRIENPCVGGSIPPQATKFQALVSQWGILNLHHHFVKFRVYPINRGRAFRPCFEQGIIFSKTFT